MKIQRAPWLRVMLALVLGVVTSVGVAWGLFRAQWLKDAGTVKAYQEDVESSLGIETTRSFGTVSTYQFIGLHSGEGSPFNVREGKVLLVGPGFRFVEAEKVTTRPAGIVPFEVGSNVLAMDRAGFPMLCVEKRRFQEHTGSFISDVSDVGRLRFSKNDWDGVPASPLWGGFAVNAAFYGAAWYLVLVAPGLLLAWSRRRSGKCPACGYDMQGLAVATCPECGKS